MMEGVLLEDVGEPLQGGTYALSEEGRELGRRPVPPHLLFRKIEETFLAAGVCHGDIRPANVLRGSDGEIAFYVPTFCPTTCDIRGRDNRDTSRDMP